MDGGDVFCVHGAFSSERQLTDLYNIDRMFVGSVDTTPTLARQYEQHQLAPLVIIKRDPQEVIESLCKLFGDTKREEISKHILNEAKALKKAEVYADLIVPFEDFDDFLEEIWEVCLPSIPFEVSKALSFKNLIINTKDVQYCSIFGKEK